MIRAHTLDGRQVIFSASQIDFCQETLSQFIRKDDGRGAPWNRTEVFLKSGAHLIVREAIDAIAQQIEEEELAKA